MATPTDDRAKKEADLARFEEQARRQQAMVERLREVTPHGNMTSSDIKAGAKLSMAENDLALTRFAIVELKRELGLK